MTRQTAASRIPCSAGVRLLRRGQCDVRLVEQLAAVRTEVPGYSAAGSGRLRSDLGATADGAGGIGHFGSLLDGVERNDLNTRRKRVGSTKPVASHYFSPELESRGHMRKSEQLTHNKLSHASSAIKVGVGEILPKWST